MVSPIGQAIGPLNDFDNLPLYRSPIGQVIGPLNNFDNLHSYSVTNKIGYGTPY